VVLSAGTTDRTGTALTETDLAAALPTTTLVCGAETITLGSLVGTAAKQRTVCTGPVMSNWLYRKALAGSNHLVAWFDVRLYKGGVVEVFPWIENGYLLVASPTNDVRTYTLTLGGTSVFTQSLDIKHHTRIPLITGDAHSYWTSDPQITPKHDTAYLMASRMVPNYGWAVDASTLSDTSNYPTTYTPNWLGSTKADMGSTGFGYHIGPLPMWSAGFIASNADQRAYKAVIVNGMAAGAWSTHYRDESTNEPFKFTTYPSVSTVWGGSPTIPGGTGGVNQKVGINSAPDRAHQPSLAFLPWLLAGRWFFLDEQLAWATWNYAQTNHTTRDGASSVFFDEQTRSRGWSLRALAETLAIIPAGHPCFSDIKGAWEGNTSAYEARYVTGTRDASTWKNNLGWLGLYSSGGNTLYFEGSGTTHWWDANWMQATMALAFGMAWDMGVPQSTGSKASHQAVRDFAYQVHIGMAGDGTAGKYNYRRFAAFQTPIGTDAIGVPPDTWLTDWGVVYAAQEAKGLDGNNALTSLPGGTSIYYGNTLIDGGYFASHSSTCFGYAALALAADHGVSGASAALTRITASSSFSTAGASFASTPIWGLAPRAASGGSPVSTGPSIRVDTASLIPGAIVVGNRGLGVLGSAIPSTGLYGPSYLYNDLVLPADANKEIRGLIVTPPSAGTFFAYEDGSFSLIGAPDGTYAFVYRLYVDGVDLGTAVGTITIGAGATLSGGAALGDVGGSGGLAGPSILGGSATLDDAGAAGGISAFPPGVSDVAGQATLSDVGATGGISSGAQILSVSGVKRNVYIGMARVRQLSHTGFTPKRVGETEIFIVDFVDVLADGETILTALWSVNVLTGIDQSPNNMVYGAPVIAGTKVGQMLTGGVSGVRYAPICTISTSEGQTLILPDVNNGALLVM
jgi:hypothetical protein